MKRYFLTLLAFAILTLPCAAWGALPVFSDNFDSSSTPENKWTSKTDGGSRFSVDTSAGLGGTSALKFTHNAADALGMLIKTVTAASETYAEGYFKTNEATFADGGTFLEIARAADVSNNVIWRLVLYKNASTSAIDRIYFEYRNNAGSQNTTVNQTVPLTADTWYRWKVHHKAHASEGVYECWWGAVGAVGTLTKDVNITAQASDSIGNVTSIRVGPNSDDNDSTTAIYYHDQYRYNTSDFTATTFYVDSGAGSDAAAGTATGTAWQTIDQVNSYADWPGFYDGDTISFNKGDTWVAGTPVGKNATGIGRLTASSVNWGYISALTFNSYGTGNRPLIDGDTVDYPIYLNAGLLGSLTINGLDYSGQEWANGIQNNLLIASSSAMTVENITITNCYYDGFGGSSSATSNASQGGKKAIRIGGDSLGDGYVTGDISITNNTFLNGGPYDLPKYTAGVDVEGVSIRAQNGASTDITISNNTIHDFNSDCIVMENIDVNSVTISGNTLYNFGEQAVDMKSVNNQTISNNEIYNDASFGCGGSSGTDQDTCNIGIVTHSFSAYFVADEIDITENYIHGDLNWGIKIGYNTAEAGSTDVRITRNLFEEIEAGFWLQDYQTRVTILGNVFINLTGHDGETPTLDTAIRLSTTSGNTSGVLVYNNSIIDTVGELDYGIWMLTAATSEIKNNIVYLSKASAYGFYAANNVAPADVTFATNCWYHTSSIQNYEGGAAKTSLIDWNAAVSAGSTGDLWENPDLSNVATGLYWPIAGSSTLDVGTALGAAYDDALYSTSVWPDMIVTVDQDDDTDWDIGAYVEGPSGSSISVASLGICTNLSTTPAFDTNPTADRTDATVLYICIGLNRGIASSTSISTSRMKILAGPSATDQTIAPYYGIYTISDVQYIAFAYTPDAGDRATDLSVIGVDTGFECNGAAILDAEVNDLCDARTLPEADIGGTGTVTVSFPGTFSVATGETYETLTAVKAAFTILDGDNFTLGTVTEPGALDMSGDDCTEADPCSITLSGDWTQAGAGLTTGDWWEFYCEGNSIVGPVAFGANNVFNRCKMNE